MIRKNEIGNLIKIAIEFEKLNHIVNLKLAYEAIENMYWKFDDYDDIFELEMIDYLRDKTNKHRMIALSWLADNIDLGYESYNSDLRKVVEALSRDDDCEIRRTAVMALWDDSDWESFEETIK